MTRAACSISLCLLTTQLVLGCSGVEERSHGQFARGEFPEAFKSIETARKAEPWNDALYSSFCASIALKAGDFERAGLELDRAHQVMEGHASERSDAVELPERVRTLVERDAPSLFRGSSHERVMNALYRAFVCLHEADYPGTLLAIDHADAVLDANPTSRAVHGSASTAALLRALAYTRLGFEEEAEAALARALSKNLDSLEAARQQLENANTLLWIDRGERPSAATSTPPDETEGATAEIQTHVRWSVSEPFVVPTSIDLTRAEEQPEVDPATPSENGFLRVIEGSLAMLGVLAHQRRETRHWTLLPARAHVWIGRLEPGQGDLGVQFDTELDEELRLPAVHVVADKLNVFYLRGADAVPQ